MRYPAAEKLEIIRLVEQAPLPVRHTLAKLGIPRATFYRWYERYSNGGPEALSDRSPRPDRVWNRAGITVERVAPDVTSVAARRRRLACLVTGPASASGRLTSSGSGRGHALGDAPRR